MQDPKLPKKDTQRNGTSMNQGEKKQNARAGELTIIAWPRLQMILGNVRIVIHQPVGC